MIIVNTEYIAGIEVEEMIGICKGSTIRAKHIGKDILSGFRTLVGGEMSEYGDMLIEARQIAMQRMVEDARGMGADAVLNVRYSTSSVMQGAAEVLVYGTAVKIKK